MEDVKSLQQQENELLQANMMGDIREDVQIIGLNMNDIWWIAGNTIVIGSFGLTLPAPVWFKFSWFLTVFLFNLVGRILKWPFRRNRWLMYLRQKKEGTGAEMDQVLNAKEDGWMYRSGDVLHILVGVTAPPWDTAILSHKRKRLNGFGLFLRNCIREGFDVSVSAEQVPDFKHDLWNELDGRQGPTEGIEKLRRGRTQMWKSAVTAGVSNRSEYYIRLSIDEYKVNIRERDDEPAGASKKELKRFRLVTEMREKLQRVMRPLEESGHGCSLLNGFVHPELIARWWDRMAWEEWKSSEGNWEEPVVEELLTVNPKEEESFGMVKDSIDDASEVVNWENITMDQEHKTEIEDKHFEENQPDEENGRLEAVLKAISRSGGTKDTHKAPETPQEASETPHEASKKGVMAALSAIFGLAVLCGKWLKRELGTIRDRIKVKRPRKTVHAEDEQQTLLQESEAAASEHEQVEQLPSPTLSGVLLITSPTPSGKTFLSSNVAAACSSEEHETSLVDLSPDQGTLTVLNPLEVESLYEGWRAWQSRHVPGMTVYTPTEYPKYNLVQQLIDQLQTKSAVLVDLPWSYPGLDLLRQHYESVAVVDANYHHWLQWEKAVDDWNGIVWLNMADQEMVARMNPVIKERFGTTPSVIFPHFTTASYWLFQGRPLAIDPQARRYFILQRKEDEAC